VDDRPTTTAGRHPDSDIFLNGTYVNREPVDSAVPANGDMVQIGKFRLLFVTGANTGDSDSVTG